MTNANERDPVTAEIYDFFRRQPGDTFDVKAIASQLAYDADEVETSLAQLLGAGVVEARSDGSETQYILSTAAPEL